MKRLIFLSFFLVSCGTTTKTPSTSNSLIIEQIFISDQTKGLPGKCYTKMKLNEDVVWTEILCVSRITKGVVSQIQTDLMRLNYEIEPSELSKAQLGSSSKEALKDFQKSNNMAYGGLDWATINRLRNK